MKSAEFILFFRKGFAKSINNMGTKTVIKVNNIIGNKLHPSEKPVELFKILINNSSREGETVLDPFAGSGTTAIAALETNRNFICIEKDQQFFDIIVERVNCKENNQLDDLF
jgi:site-specific DNA-methyltransferase (adenine-specific)